MAGETPAPLVMWNLGEDALAVRCGRQTAPRSYNLHMVPSSSRPPTSRQPEATLQPAVWEFAGLLLTYWCNSRCAICYLSCGPDRGGRLELDHALRLWRGLDQLATNHGKTMRIHLAGGEPFGDWGRLVSIIRAARDAGLTPLEKVETNAHWAASAGLTRARLELLDALGMEKLIVSTDVYHQEFVPFERVRLCVETARQVLGRGRVLVRWWDFYNAGGTSTDPANTPADRELLYRAALERHRDRLAGRAAQQLAHLLPCQPPEAYADQNCVNEVLHSRHVHIDPYGNIFPGTCGGIILCRLAPTDLHEIADLWKNFATNWRANPVVDAVVTGGSYELYQRVRTLGYEPLPGGYANKCHLCAHLRQFLVQRNLWPAHVGPPECYPDDRPTEPTNY